MAKKKILAWHFLKEGRLLRDDKEAPPVGETLVHEGEIKICQSGLHASKDILDALGYAPGEHLCRVECYEVEKTHDDKFVCRERTIIAEADITTELHIFAIWCAEQALDLIDKPDPRSLEALRAKRLWLDGKATDKELAAARDAARAAAWAAAWDAAGAAARTVAMDAARAAAGAAARDAAWAAAWAAARAATRAATWAATWAAARDAQRIKLLELIEPKFKLNK